MSARRYANDRDASGRPFSSARISFGERLSVTQFSVLFATASCLLIVYGRLSAQTAADTDKAYGWPMAMGGLDRFGADTGPAAGHQIGS